MADKVTHWGGWTKLSREDLEKQEIEKPTKIKKDKEARSLPPPPPPPSLPTGPVLFNIDSLKKISKDSLNEEAQATHARVISGIDSVAKPKLCGLCGATLVNDDTFMVSFPEEKLICRKCRQTLPQCATCQAIVKNPIKELPKQYCNDCKKKRVCSCCENNFEENLATIPGNWGNYCVDCLANSEKCVFCGVPTHKKSVTSAGSETPVCSRCDAAPHLILEDWTEIYEKIIEFFYKIDKHFLGTPMVLMNCMDRDTYQKNNNCLYVEIATEKIYFINKIPKPIFIEKILDFHSGQVLEGFRKVPTKSPLAEAILYFVKYLYYESNFDFLKSKQIKNQFIENSKLYPIFMKMYEKGGGNNALTLLRKQLEKR